MIVPDFTNCDFGLLVTRSKHFLETRYIKPNSKKQYGIIVGKKFYADSRGLPICWPLVHWEGEVNDSLTHPSLVVAVRKKQRESISDIEMIEE